MSMQTAQPLTIPALRQVGTARATALAMLISAAVSAFLFWLIYFRGGSGGAGEAVLRLPAINASLNALSTTLLVAGYVAIRQGHPLRHARLMLAALASSGLFLVGYVTYYAVAGNTPFEGQGLIRPIYFFILISHIVLSVAVLPLILLSVFLSLAGHFSQHRRVARYALPIWLYVSVTGVLVFVLLRLIAW
jgi:putative membrane protein